MRDWNAYRQFEPAGVMRRFKEVFLSTEGELLRWKGQGLPTDKLSSENAIVILHAHSTPLIIDRLSPPLAGHQPIPLDRLLGDGGDGRGGGGVASSP